MLIDLEEMRRATPEGARLIGVDLGAKTIGLALSDPTWTIASPLETIRRGKFAADAQTLFALMDRHGAGGLLVGLPTRLDGRPGPRTQASRAFVQNLLAMRDMPIAFWDERLSTAAVERMLIREVDVTRARRAQLIDKLAAAYILQGALDRLSRL
jgi:putative Holliday junction resolvase